LRENAFAAARDARLAPGAAALCGTPR